jgi:hypothetical protein
MTRHRCPGDTCRTCAQAVAHIEWERLRGNETPPNDWGDDDNWTEREV